MLGAMASGLWRGAVVLIMAVVACAGPGGGLPALSGVDTDESQGTLALVTGCYDRVGGDAVLRDGQIVVTDLWGEGASHNDCARGVPLDLGPGPDVVYPRADASLRYATIGMFAGVYPLDVVRCEGRWALLDPRHLRRRPRRGRRLLRGRAGAGPPGRPGRDLGRDRVRSRAVLPRPGGVLRRPRPARLGVRPLRG